VLTATKGRPPDSTEQVLAVQEDLVAATGGRHIVVPEAGHYLHIDRPDLVVQAVRDVLQSQPEGS
jgi:pimeloyl-ACP methyl ester carboxylesterase